MIRPRMTGAQDGRLYFSNAGETVQVELEAMKPGMRDEG